MYVSKHMGGGSVEHEVMRYFQNAQVPDAKKQLAKRAGFELCRGNISTMKQLCGLCEHSPEKLLQIRNIGEKTAALILEICAMYKTEHK